MNSSKGSIASCIDAFPCTVAPSAAQYLQNVIGCVRLAEPRKNLLHAMTVRVSVTVGHRIHDQHHVVAVVVCAARRRFHAATGRDARQEDLGYATLTQVIMQ